MSRHLVDRRTLAGDVAFALESKTPPPVLAATEASAELRQASLVAPLTRLVENQDAEIRNKAVYALGGIGDRRAAQVLLASSRRCAKRGC
jgi:HEAT repeat protein